MVSESKSIVLPIEFMAKISGKEIALGVIEINVDINPIQPSADLDKITIDDINIPEGMSVQDIKIIELEKPKTISFDKVRDSGILRVPTSSEESVNIDPPNPSLSNDHEEAWKTVISKLEKER